MSASIEFSNAIFTSVKENTTSGDARNPSHVLNQKDFGDLTLLHYRKDILSTFEQDYDGTYSKYRSIIFDKNGIMISCSPFKSISQQKFQQTYDLDNINVVLEEFVEGTMINVFHDGNEWQISTRTCIGGSNTFYNNGVAGAKSFKTMFEEVCRDVGFSYDMLDKDISYSFVMQHLDNRVVSQYQFNELVLIEAYKITHNEADCVVEFLDIQSLQGSFTGSKVRFPMRFDKEKYHEYNDVKKNFDIDIDDTKINKSSILQNVDTILKGVIIKNLTNGHRMKFRNTTYDYLAKLRGNQAKLEFHYMTLRKDKKISLFLHIYPEYEQRFMEFRDKIHNFTQALFFHYFKCFKERSIALKEAPYELRAHLYELHGKYINELRPAKKTMQFQDVKDYVNQLPEARLMYSLNFNTRSVKMKKYVDANGEECVDL